MAKPSAPEPVAIVGMACRLPGGVNNPEEFWEFLVDGQTGYSDFPADRLNIDSWYHPEAVRPGSVVTRGGFFLKHDMNEFDNEFFNISAAEAALMDPAQKQLMEVVYESAEAAGMTAQELRGSKTGVYIGNFGLDQALMALKDSEFMSPYTSTGISGTILSNRINYALDLKGPSFTVDTACSSSIYALHLAVLGLQNGDCDGAFVGAANAIRSIEAQLFSTKLGALSKTSRCHTFDESADGYARADGIGAIYIMRLSDALRSGRPIRAVIRGTAIGANGRGEGLTKPDSAGQARTIRHAYRNAGITDLTQTGYFECHGTGTPVGDPIETHSVSSVFAEHRAQDDPLLIGSVKSNLGHSEATAGITALIKTVLAIENKLIPPTIGITKLNPAIKFDDWKIRVVQQATSWPSSIPIRRASVNSFGYGGANAHVIVEGLDSVLQEYTKEHPDTAALFNTVMRRHYGSNDALSSSDEDQDDKASSNSTPPSSTLLLCSAKKKESLQKVIEATKARLESSPTAAEDIAYTLSRRSRFAHSAYAIIPKNSEAEPEPVAFVSDQVPKNAKLGFIFTGQGAQWPQMGMELLQFPAFRNSIREIDTAMSLLPDGPEWSVEEMMCASISASEMDEPSVAQLMSIAVEVALVDLLADWNVHPTMTGGHSAGEIAAAYTAGYLTRAEAAAVAYYRGKAVSAAKLKPGAMLAVGLGEEESRKLIPEGADVVVAAINSPRSVTLSGDQAAINQIKAHCDAQNIFNRVVATKGIAYHSAYMEPAAAAYDIPLRKMARDPSGDRAKLPFFSTVKGARWTEDELPMSYWRQNMERPVSFLPAVSAMFEAGLTHVVEIGPHSALRSPILDIVKAVSTASGTFKYLAAMKRKEDAVNVILTTCGELALHGIDVDVARVNGGAGKLLHDFPLYPWDHRNLSKEARADVEWRQRKFPRHDLLGSVTPGSALSTHIWRNVLSMNHVPWLADHKVGDHYIFPAAGFISMAIEAMRQVRESDPEQSSEGEVVFVLEDIHIGAAMMVDDDVEVFLTMRKQVLSNNATSASFWEFNISSVKDGISTEHAKGRVSSAVKVPHHSARVLPEASMALAHPIPESLWYETLTASKGLIFGPSFRRLSDIVLEATQHRAQASLAGDVSSAKTGLEGESSYTIHPTVLDNCLQLSVLAAGDAPSGQAYVPVSVERLTVMQDEAVFDMATLHSSGKHVGFKGLHGASQVDNTTTGRAILTLDGLRFVGIPAGGELGRSESKREPFWRMSWEDDYDAITKESEELYFPSEKYWPKQYDYPRERRVYLICMGMVQFSRRYPELMTREPTNVENKHFIEWAHWLLPIIEKQYPDMWKMTMEERDAIIEAERPICPEGLKLTWALYDNLHRIIDGQVQVLEIATKDGMLGHFYETQLIYDKFERAVEILGYKNPTMKILEIGAGTGSATGFVLNALTKGGTKRYASYTYTDVSTSFFIQAADKFSQYDDIDYRLYDMEKSPEEQDIEPESFDLVIASCVVHVTPNAVNALKNIRKMLKPGGKILLSEITAEHHDQTFTLGLFPGFYKGYDEGRTRHPFLTPEQWADAFVKSGFSEPELSVNDIPEDWFGFTVLSAAAVDDSETAQADAREKTITLVHLNEPKPIAFKIEQAAKEQGLSVIHRPLVQRDSAGVPVNIPSWDGTSRVIVIAELERLIWSTIEEPEYLEFQKMAREASSILWVTQGGLMAGQYPEAAIVNGFFQCLDLKPDLTARSMDFELSTPHGSDMAREIIRREGIMHKSKDMQFRQHEGRWLIPRLLPDQRLVDDFARAQGDDISTLEKPLRELGPLQVSTTDAGRLSALVFKPDETKRGSLAPGHVEVQVKAYGMNYVELSALAGGYDTESLSSEFSGVVSRVAPDVQDLQVGDRVFAMWPGKFGNVERLPHYACQKAKPSGQDSFEELATLPSAYCTAWYALVNVARVQPGETVFIQSATGGFGLAAIAVARMHGAEVFVTAGSEAKRAMLHEQLGIPRDHIFPSRDLSVYADLKAATAAHGGFDVILNTSQGDYLHQVTWPLVAPFGRFVELKKADIVDNGSLPLKKFADGVTFTAVDLNYVSETRHKVLTDILAIVGDKYRSGQITSLPWKSFPVSNIGGAYGEFSRFEHTGKLVLTYGDDDVVSYLPVPSKPRFDPGAAYLVVGGLSGIGAFLSKWMVQQGAKTLVFLSRSALSGETAENATQLRSMGAAVLHVQGSVSDEGDVRRALTVSGLPVRGIVNSALVLRNMEFDKLTCAEAHETFAPKIGGNYNLHRVSRELGYGLDFFVLLASLTSICRAATQASYSAANCFMDEFCRFRHRQGLPCTTVSLGVIGDVGFMGRNQGNMQHLIRNGHYVTIGRELMDLFETALFRRDDSGAWKTDEVVALGTEPTKLRELIDKGSVPVPLWERDLRWSIIGTHASRSHRGSGGSGAAGAGGRLQGGDIKDIVADRLSRLLWIPVEKLNLEASLNSMGIDSMIASEFRHWMYQTFKTNVSMMELLAQDMTVGKLAGLLQQKAA
ncbi:polyketide synthase [Immersiella caudata]|uniref:Polyketide synthase n=1 Tax=Immersiella caudata TaxID=314043 RepID=A0AA39WD73_9PEZI|nr:polyketide synthase [Immersiella caudata]